MRNLIILLEGVPWGVRLPIVATLGLQKHKHRMYFGGPERTFPGARVLPKPAGLVGSSLLSQFPDPESCFLRAHTVQGGSIRNVVACTLLDKRGT